MIKVTRSFVTSCRTNYNLMTACEYGNMAAHQFITILWAVYFQVYLLDCDNRNTFVNDTADKPWLCWWPTYNWKMILSATLYPIPNFAVNTSLISIVVFLVSFKDTPVVTEKHWFSEQLFSNIMVSSNAWLLLWFSPISLQWRNQIGGKLKLIEPHT